MWGYGLCRKAIRSIMEMELTSERPYANTKGQWLASRILAGFFTAPAEALPEISVTDVVGLT